MRCGPDTRIWHPELSTILDCSIGNHCVIHSHVWIGNNVKIGDACKIQAFAFIPDGVTIGNGVFIGPRVTFTNDREPPSTTWHNTVVDDDVTIGAGAVIVAGVRLYAGSRIGAGAVVTKDTYPDDWWVGNPAKPLHAA
jgi:UDP-2-acetamido-3-amino-2,3-dideoxy-glucuronate N-acetyltransferase